MISILNKIVQIMSASALYLFALCLFPWWLFPELACCHSKMDWEIQRFGNSISVLNFVIDTSMRKRKGQRHREKRCDIIVWLFSDYARSCVPALQELRSYLCACLAQQYWFGYFNKEDTVNLHQNVKSACNPFFFSYHRYFWRFRAQWCRR